ncbi:hypothetical protein COB72_09265 [bacterium]|nr:MAG: hypothetical protein COB72_09265 [bacterium]
MLEGSPCRLLFANDVSQAAYGAPAGIFEGDTLGTLLVDNAGRQNKAIMLGQIDGKRARGCIIRPLADDGVANNATINVRVLTIRPIEQHGKFSNDGKWLIEHIGDLVCTVGNTLTNKSLYGSAQAGQYRAIDTLVYTPTDLGTALAGVFDPAPVEYSPGGDEQGMLIMPDLAGAQGLILDPIDSRAFNALVELVT